MLQLYNKIFWYTIFEYTFNYRVNMIDSYKRLVDVIIPHLSENDVTRQFMLYLCANKQWVCRYAYSQAFKMYEKITTDPSSPYYKYVC